MKKFNEILTEGSNGIKVSPKDFMKSASTLLNMTSKTLKEIYKKSGYLDFEPGGDQGHASFITEPKIVDLRLTTYRNKPVIQATYTAKIKDYDDSKIKSTFFISFDGKDFNGEY